MGDGQRVHNGGSFLNAIILGTFNILGLRWLLLLYPTSKCGGLSLELPVFSSYLHFSK